MSTPARTPTAARAATIAALGEALRASSALAVLFSQAVADRVGISPTDLESLDILIRHGPLTAGRLAELTGLSTGAITGLVDRLEERGYAQREPDPHDRRRVVVRAVAERTEADLGPAYAAMAAATESLIARYNDEELALIRDFMERAVTLGAEQIARARTEAPVAATRGRRPRGPRPLPETHVDPSR